MVQKAVTFGNAQYPLEHLSSFRVVVGQKDPLAAPAVLQVTISCHVFSEKWEDGMDEARRYIEDGETRAFCPVRYGCSIGLRQIVNYHIEGKAYEGRDSNGAMNHFFYAEAEGIAYPVFFRLGKATKIPGVDGILHIISAYQNPKLPARNRLQSVKFARLVHTKCPPPAPEKVNGLNPEG
jgi:hypothetical protein